MRNKVYISKISFCFLHTLHTLECNSLVIRRFLSVCKILSCVSKSSEAYVDNCNEELGFVFVPRGGTVCPRGWDVVSHGVGQNTTLSRDFQIFSLLIFSF